MSVRSLQEDLRKAEAENSPATAAAVRAALAKEPPEPEAPDVEVDDEDAPGDETT